ncbi:N-acetylglucosaminyldiphosphodolichol N-acetylglucosaminyltransferase catalytic subunit alg13 [Sporothrix epigloea]|uniref:UDP-N-acetylglucosamine transferase subunit ALG13 n=1 Tax=Sporothrix epigloea TaxID=1892477 RepID=A0ABP0D430_9PEZI
MDDSPARLLGRRCFVTVGATASFIKLLREVLAPNFLDFLAARDFCELVVQTGPDHEWALQQVASLGELAATRTPDTGKESPRWPVIDVIPYTTDILSMMLLCRGEAKRRLAGAMISHAGSGSILDAARCDAPLIVVANPDLLGNHQVELAEAVHDAGWAIHGELGHLEDALANLLTRQAQEHADGLPPYQEPTFPIAESERCGLFDWAALYAVGGEPGSMAADPNLLRLD